MIIVVRRWGGMGKVNLKLTPGHDPVYWRFSGDDYDGMPASEGKL